MHCIARAHGTWSPPDSSNRRPPFPARTQPHMCALALALRAKASARDGRQQHTTSDPAHALDSLQALSRTHGNPIAAAPAADVCFLDTDGRSPAASGPLIHNSNAYHASTSSGAKWGCRSQSECSTAHCMQYNRSDPQLVVAACGGDKANAKGKITSANAERSQRPGSESRWSARLSTALHTSRCRETLKTTATPAAIASAAMSPFRSAFGGALFHQPPAGLHTVRGYR